MEGAIEKINGYQLLLNSPLVDKTPGKNWPIYVRKIKRNI